MSESQFSAQAADSSDSSRDAPSRDIPANMLQKLREYPLFAQLSDEEFRRVVSLLRIEQTPQGALLFEQGGSNTNLYLLRTGRAATRMVDLDDQEHLTGFINAGSIFNEMAFLSGAHNTQTVEALEALTLWYISRDEFLALMQQAPEIESRLRVPDEPEAPGAALVSHVRVYPWQRPNEIVLMFRKKHPWVFIRTLWPLPFLAVMMALLLLPPLNAFVAGLLPGIFIGIAIFVIPYVLLRFIDWQNDYYAITDQRVLHRERVLLIHDVQDEVPLSKIQDVTIDRPSFLALMIDFGDITIEAMGHRARVRFREIGKPDEVGELIFQQLARARVESHASQRSKIRGELRRELGLGSNSPASTPKPIKLNTLPRFRQRVREYGLSMRALRNSIWPFMRLVQGDTITYRKHWLILLQTIALPVVVTLAYVVLLTVIRLSAPDLAALLFRVPLVLVIGIVGVALLFWLVYRYEDWRNDMYMVTSERVVDIYRTPFGLFGTSRREAKLGAIQNVTYKTLGFVDVLFNIGDVIIQTAGSEGALTFDRVHDPRRVQSDVVDRIEAFEAMTREKRAAERRQEMTEWLGIYDELTRLHERRRLG